MAQPGQRKVMLCLDGSETANYMFQWYIDNLMKKDDYCYGVVVVEYDVGAFTAGGGDALEICKKFADKKDEKEKLTADYAAQLRSAGVKGQVDTFSGNKPGDIICDTADMLDVDCIVIGTRGLGAVKRAFLGSVSQNVINNSGRPVTVVPKPK